MRVGPRAAPNCPSFSDIPNDCPLWDQAWGGEWRQYTSSQLNCKRRGRHGKSVLTYVSTRTSFGEHLLLLLLLLLQISPAPLPLHQPSLTQHSCLQWILWILPGNCPHPGCKINPHFTLSNHLLSPMCGWHSDPQSQRYFNLPPTLPQGKWRQHRPKGTTTQALTTLLCEIYYHHIHIVFHILSTLL